MLSSMKKESSIKTLIRYTILLFFLFIHSGCVLLQMAEDTKELYRTSTSHGYQNGIKPDEIQNVKDFIADENEFVILAETSYQTLYTLQNRSLSGKKSMISDLADYCDDINGKTVYGRQVGAAISREFSSIELELSSIKSDYKKNRVRSYPWWMKCTGSEDDFEVKRKRGTYRFVITHKKEQEQDYQLRWFMDYYNIKEFDLEKQSRGRWLYASFIQFAAYCEYHGGKSYVSNTYTADKAVALNKYLLRQIDPTAKEKGYLLGQGEFICKGTVKNKHDFKLTIDYESQYRGLLYTKQSDTSITLSD